MVTIVKSKKTNQFMVVVTGGNGEKLSTSELLKTKQSAWKNIYAMAENFNANKFSVFQVNDQISPVKSVSYVVEINSKGQLEKQKMPF